MDDLELTINQGKILGKGTDMVADFQLAGNLREDGTVEIRKQYHHKHAVLYVGKYDGEGSFFGNWDIQGYQGTWFIRLLQASANAQDIQDIA